MPISTARARCVAAQMAIDDFGGTVLGKKIEMVSADIQNKADVAATIARRWYDTEQVDVILGAGASSSSIATAGVAGEKKKIYLATDPASSDITGKLCNRLHGALGLRHRRTGQRHRLGAWSRRAARHWFFLTADYAFGYALERDVTARRDARRRQGAGRASSTRSTPATSRRTCCRRRPPRRRSSASPMPAATPSTRSSRPPSSASSRAARSSPALLVFISDVHALGLPARAGAQPHRGVLLGPQRQDPRLRQALRREEQRQDADQRPGRLLFGGAAVSQRGQGRRHR